MKKIKLYLFNLMENNEIICCYRKIYRDDGTLFIEGFKKKFQLFKKVYLKNGDLSFISFYTNDGEASVWKFYKKNILHKKKFFL